MKKDFRFHTIREVRMLGNCEVLAFFAGGEVKRYDFGKLAQEEEMYAPLLTTPGLFEAMVVSPGGHGLIWNEDIDIASEEIWENGVSVPVYADCLADQIDNVFVEIQRAIAYGRHVCNMTQQDLSLKTGIAQSDISKFENGTGNPSIRTLNRLAEGMGMRMRLEFEPVGRVED